MQLRRVIAASGCFASALVAGPGASLQAEQRPPDVSAGRAIGQGAAGLVAMPIGFIGGGLATRWAAHRSGSSDDAASKAALVGAYSVAALTTAAGPTIVGGGPHATGSYPSCPGGHSSGGRWQHSTRPIEPEPSTQAGCFGSLAPQASSSCLPLAPPIGVRWSRRYAK